MNQIVVVSPIGPLEIIEENGAISFLKFGRTRSYVSEGTALLMEAKEQLQNYFNRHSVDFDLPLAPAATLFQEKMRAYMLAIPAGETRSYGEAAEFLSSAPRSAGQACRLNPIPVIVPCHRIIAADGQLRGYSGGKGLQTKRFLLNLETKKTP